MGGRHTCFRCFDAATDLPDRRDCSTCTWDADVKHSSAVRLKTKTSSGAKSGMLPITTANTKLHRTGGCNDLYISGHCALGKLILSSGRIERHLVRRLFYTCKHTRTHTHMHTHTHTTHPDNTCIRIHTHTHTRTHTHALTFTHAHKTRMHTH